LLGVGGAIESGRGTKAAIVVMSSVPCGPVRA
jgi:hypothetical protein